MAKEVLSGRLDGELAARIRAHRERKKLSTNDVIELAFDALDREENMSETLLEKMQTLEKNLLALIDLMTVFNVRFDQAGINEKERLKSLYTLLEARIRDHDEAEQTRHATHDEAERTRFDTLKPRGL